MLPIEPLLTRSSPSRPVHQHNRRRSLPLSPRLSPLKTVIACDQNPSARLLPGGWGVDVDAVQHLVEQHAVDAAPYPAQLERRRVPELGDGDEAGAVKTLVHALADAVDVVQLEAEQNFGQVIPGDDDQPV